MLSWFEESDYRDYLRGLSERLLRYGLREGVDFHYEFRQTRSQAEVDAVIAARRGGYDVIHTTNTSPASFVMASGSKLPHVFATYSDPVAARWIETYTRPGGSATGVVELALAYEKRLDILRRVVPRARRIAVVLETSGGAAEDSRQAAAHFGRAHPEIAIHEIRVSSGEAVADIARKLREARVDAAYVPLGGQMAEMSSDVFKALARERIPAAGDRLIDTLQGAVVALELDRSPHLDSLASQLAMILRGASPSDIPVHSPRRLMLMVNLDAARALGVQLPRSVVRQADLILSDGKF